MSAPLNSRKLVLAVDGGPDAFASADVARRLVRAGAAVRVAVTATTERWLPALTLATVTRSSVARSVEEGRNLSREADGVLVWASGAELVSGIATGRVIDAAGASFLYSSAPRVLAPSSSLPEAGWLGALLRALSEDALVLARGRPPNEAVRAVERALGPRDLDGRRVMVTAGPTREHIDPVRFISNPASGRMGISLAEIAARRGAEVTLLLGPTSLLPPPRVRTLRFETADRLFELASETAGESDVIIAAAAVGDYAPVSPMGRKMKKREGELRLVLRRTPDVLARLGERFEGKEPRPVLVGFAAETENVIANARRKLVEKRVDLVVANDVSRTDTGFESVENEVTLVGHEGEEDVPRADKLVVAEAILDRVVDLLASSPSAIGRREEPLDSLRRRTTTDGRES